MNHQDRLRLQKEQKHLQEFEMMKQAAADNYHQNRGVAKQRKHDNNYGVGAGGPTASSFGITDKSNIPHTMGEANF